MSTPRPTTAILVVETHSPREYILRTLDAAAGNQSLTARILGIDRRTLTRRLQELKPSDQPD